MAVVAAAGLTFGLVSANAADIIEPMPAGHDWMGAYIGLNAGYAFSNNEVGTENVGPSAVIQGVIDGTGAGAVDLDPDGFIGGGQIGYNWQMDSIVLGIEADAQYADVRGSETLNANPPAGFRARISIFSRP